MTSNYNISIKPFVNSLDYPAADAVAAAVLL